MADASHTIAMPIAQTFGLPRGPALKNRIAKSAMSEQLGTTDNRVAPALPRLYARWAQGGTGLLITGNVMIDRRALGEPNNVALEDDRDLDAFRAWAAAGKADGTRIWMQLNHPGKQSPKGLNTQNYAPSAIGFGKALAPFFDTPRELSEAQIEDIIARFGEAAALAKAAGFDGVQIHGAHGYLVSQFLSPLHNQRSDGWGGSAEKRRRFVLAVYAEMRKRVGEDFPVGIKLNSADFQRGGFAEEESLDVVQALSDAGIDLIEISGGTYEAPAMSLRKTPVKESSRAREAYFLEFAEKVRARVKTPLMVTGGFRSAQGMNEALESGALDLVGIARPLAVEPELPARLLRGEAPRHPLRSLITGIEVIDRAGLMEVAWYSRQLRRLGEGREPRPNESPLWSFFAGLGENGVKTFRTRRLRA